MPGQALVSQIVTAAERRSPERATPARQGAVGAQAVSPGSGKFDVIVTRVTDALEEPHNDLLERVRAAGALNMDETGWRTAGERRALWGAFTDRHVVLRIVLDRHEDQAKALLGDTTAIVTSDT